MILKKARSLVERHEAINKIERVLRKTHIKRLNKGECSTQAGVNFIDIISHYTRVSDHAMNLAEKVLQNKSKNQEAIHHNWMAFCFS